MLEIKQIHINVMPIAGGRFFLSAEDFNGFDLKTYDWKKLLFSAIRRVIMGQCWMLTSGALPRV